MEDETLKQLQKQLDQQMEQFNRAPRKDFDNLCSLDMEHLLYNTLGEESALQYKKNIPGKLLDKIPFLQLVLDLFRYMESGKEMKLTAKGNLTLKTIEELYAKGHIKEEMIERGFYKKYKESDTLSIQDAKIIAQLAGLTKKRYNKLSLTKTGTKLFETSNHLPLLKKIFETFAFKFNLGYHDGYRDQGSVQPLFGYTLYLLVKYGQKERPIEFYVRKNLEAFPQVLDYFPETYSMPEQQFTSCYYIRFFDRFLNMFNFTSTREEPIPNDFRKKYFVKTNLLLQIFEIEPKNFQFTKRRFFA